MTDKPIPFSGSMILALLDGRKTQERQILKPQPPEGMAMYRYYGDDAPRPDLRHTFGWMVPEAGDLWPCNDADRIVPKYAVGDRLWVREAHYMTDDGEAQAVVYTEDDAAVAQHHSDIARLQEQYGLSDAWARPHMRIRPSIQMPRWASRLTLIVTDVRVQRLQEITDDDAQAEGIERLKSGRGFYDPTLSKGAVHFGAKFDWASDAFGALWNSIYGLDAWNANPWVAAYTFTVHRCNIDQMSDKKASDH